MNWATRDVDVYRAPERHYLGGEPIFIPGPGRGAGVVMCQQFDAGTSASAFVAFDAFNISAGPIATIAMPSPVPFLFHSVFAPAGS